MIYYNNNCKIKFEEYVQTHESHDKINGNACSIWDLGLHPTGNEQVGNYFYILKTRNITIIHNHCNPLPIPDDVTNRICEISKNDPMGIEFTNNNNNEIEDEDYEND